MKGKKFKIWQFVYFARQIHLLPYLSYQGSNSQWDWKNIWSPEPDLSHNLPSFQLSLPDSHVSLHQVHHGLNSFEPSFFISLYQTMPLTLCSFLIWSKLHRASLQTLFSITLSFAEPTSHNPKPKWFSYMYIEKMIEKEKSHYHRKTTPYSALSLLSASPYFCVLILPRRVLHLERISWLLPDKYALISQ